MKILDKNPALCTGCRECEKTCSKLWFKEENREKSCIRIGDSAGDITVCDQCGECINICPVQALYRDKAGIVRLDKNRCVGCFMCVGFCPTSAIFMNEEYTEPMKCIVCGACAKNCPTKAIFVTEK